MLGTEIHFLVIVCWTKRHILILLSLMTLARNMLYGS